MNCFEQERMGYQLDFLMDSVVRTSFLVSFQEQEVR